MNWLTFVSVILMLPFYGWTSEAPKGLTFQGRILRPSGIPLEATIVYLKVKVLSPTNDCVLLEENHSVPMAHSGGVFSLVIGAGIRAGADKGFSLEQIFKNSGTLTGLTCGGIGITDYQAQSGHYRRVRVIFNDGKETVTLDSDFVVRSIPYAMIADSLQGKSPDDFIQKNQSGTKVLTQTNLEQIFEGVAFDELVKLINGTSDQYAKSTALPVSGGSLNMSTSGKDIIVRDTPSSGDSAVNKDYVDAAIALAGGGGGGPHTHDAADIVSGTLDAARIPTGTDNTKLPLSGGTMTGDLNMGGKNILGAGHITMSPEMTINLGTYDDSAEDTLDNGLTGADKGKFWYNTTSNQIKFWNGSAVIALGASGSSLQSLNGATGNNQTLQLGTAGTAPAISRSGDVHTLDIPLASASALGVAKTGAGLTATSGVIAPDFGSGIGKVVQGNDERLAPAPMIADALSYVRMNAGGTAYEVVTPADLKTSLSLGTMSNEAAADYLTKAGNLSGLADASVARTNLGATATGASLFTAADAAAARTTIGATTTGSSLMTATDATAGRAALGLGTAATSATTDFIGAVTPGTSGNVLISNGTNWTSAALPVATGAARGVVQVGTGLAVSSGTVSADFGAGAGKVVEGNDARLNPAPLVGDAGKGVRVNAGGTGYETFVLSDGGDFMKDGSVTMTGNLRLGGQWISNDGNNEGIRVDDSGNVGIGTASPSANFNVVTTTATSERGIMNTQISNDIKPGVFIGQKARGSVGSLSAVADGDLITTLLPYAYDGSVFQQTGYAGFAVRGTVSGGSVPTDFVINTGSSGLGSERLRISSDGNVGVGTSSPDATALLDLTSTAKGLLIPRMTEAQRDAIPSPAAGLQVYNTDTNKINFFNGASWSELGAGGGGGGDVMSSLTLTAGTGLTGGGNLSANRTFAVDFGTGAGKVVQGNDVRLAPAPTGLGGQFVRVNAGATAYETVALGTMATATATDYLSKAGNLSGLADSSVARTNLGATVTGASLFTAADATAARTALGLGTAATAASTDFIAAVTPGTSGNVLTSNGTNWTSAALPVATGAAKGIMQVGTGLSVSSGTVTPDFGSGVGKVTQGNDVRLAPAPLLADAGKVVRVNAGGTGYEVATASSGSVTYPLLADDGSAAAPSFSFSNSNNTGFYMDGPALSVSVASNQTAMFTANSTWIKSELEIANEVSDIYGADQGTSASPSTQQLKLANSHAADGVGSYMVSQVVNADDNEQRSYIGTVSVAGGSTFAPHVVFGVSTGGSSHVERMRIASNGNVGIGTTTPYSTLQVGPINNTAFNGTLALGSTSGQSSLLFSSKRESQGAGDSQNVGGIYAEAESSWSSKLHFKLNNNWGNPTINAMTLLSNNGSVGVGIGTSSPAATALLDLTSTVKGFLIPRMTEAQRDAISSPARGLQVYNTDSDKINFFNGSTWAELGASAGGGGDVMSSLTLTAGSGLTGGGNLSANRTFAVDFGTGAGKVVQGNDARLAPAPTGLGGQFVRVNAGATAYETVALGTMATATATDYLSKAGNLSGLADASVARTNLGATATGASLFTAANASAARTALGLGTAATAASTDFIAAVTPGTSGNVLTSNGAAWTSAALPIATATVNGIMNTGAGLVVSSGEVTPDFGTGAGKVTQGNDARLAPAPILADAGKIVRVNAGGTGYEVTSVTSSLGYTPVNKAGDSGLGIMDFTSGNFVRFGHANQSDGNDGKIGAGMFGEGLNIVGTQTVAAGGRKVQVWGNIWVNGGTVLSNNQYYHIRDSGGTSKALLGVDTSNTTRLYSGGGTMHLNPDQNLSTYLNFNNTSPVIIGNGVTNTHLFVSKGNVNADAYCDASGGNCKTPSSLLTSTAADAAYARIDGASIDQWLSFRVLRNAAASGDGMYIGYGNTNSATTKIYSAGSTNGHYYSDASGNILRSDGAAYLHTSNLNSSHVTTALGYTPLRFDVWAGNQYFGSDGSHYAKIFRDTDDGNYYTDPNGTSVMNSITFYGTLSGSGAGLTGTASGLTAGAANSVAWGNVSGKPFNWAGQSGQPAWLWGSNDGISYYVWNPSNFNVNYANSAGSASSASVAASLSSTADNVSTSGWYRSNGNVGWYNNTHGGGIWMQDSSWIRTYGSKNFYVQGGSLAVDGNVGIGTTNPTSKLTVVGTIESTSGGVKFPDGSVQTTAATSSGVTGCSNTSQVFTYSGGTVNCPGGKTMVSGGVTCGTDSGGYLTIVVSNAPTANGWQGSCWNPVSNGNGSTTVFVRCCN